MTAIRRPVAGNGAVNLSVRAVLLGCLALIAVTAAAYVSLLAAAALTALIVVVIAMEAPVLPLLVGLLWVRELIDGNQGTQSRAGAHLSLTVAVAAAIILLAAGAWLRRLVIRRALVISLVAILGGTLVAVHGGGSSMTLASREGVREASIVAVAVLVFNSPALSLERVVRICQWLGVVPALFAIYQLATNSGMVVGHHHRAQATFSHPNSAAVFFAIPLLLSLWSLVERRRRTFDLVMTGGFALASLATGSLAGLGGALIMVLVLAVMRRASLATRFGVVAAGAAVAVGFAVSPLGAARLSTVSSASLSANAFSRGQSANSFDWRLYNWRTLLPLWRQHPIVGSGLGTTTTGTTQTGTLPHNEYIRYLVEGGLVGLILVVLGLVMLVRRLTALSHAAAPQVASAGAVGLAITVGMAANAIAANTVLYTPAIYLATFVLAAILRTAESPGAAPPPAQLRVPGGRTRKRSIPGPTSAARRIPKVSGRPANGAVLNGKTARSRLAISSPPDR